MKLNRSLRGMISGWLVPRAFRANIGLQRVISARCILSASCSSKKSNILVRLSSVADLSKPMSFPRYLRGLMSTSKECAAFGYSTTFKFEPNDFLLRHSRAGTQSSVTALLLHREVRLEERRTLAVVRYIAQGFAHAVAQDHSAGDVGNARKIVCSAGRHLIEYDMLSGAPPQKHRHFSLKLGTGHQIAVLYRPLNGVAERTYAARDNRHFVNRVGAR